MTKRLLLPPYFHPTTACFVDDNESFLNSLQLQLPKNSAFLTYADPIEALEFLNTPPPLPPLVDRCFSSTPRDQSDTVIHLDLSMIEHEIKHPERFRRISAAFIDFSMPTMNGLDLLNQLTDPYLKKVLLTGVADEKTAVEAFNVGLIDRFLPKSRTNAVGAIVQFVDELEQEYFTQHTARLEQTLAIDPPGFLVDAVTANYIRRLLKRERLLEFYLVNDPMGFLCLRGDGSMVRLIINDDKQVDASAEFAARHGAPNDIINRLKKRKSVAAFLDSPDHYTPDDPYPWQENLVSARAIAGERMWYIGMLKNPPMDIDFDFRTSTYDAYRSRVRAN